MICRHCGKEYSDNFAYCPYCAEPKPEREKSLEEKYIERVDTEYKRWNIGSMVGSTVFCVLATLLLGPIGLLIGIINFVVMLVYGKTKNKKAKNPGRQFVINSQFSNDQTSICPKCGSHDIKIYRKGYDYGHGFWFRKYGGGYTAGIDRNTACCRCMNCGNDWETDYDYRLINK